jgi:lipid-binding SYLF domain-containing protein
VPPSPRTFACVAYQERNLVVFKSSPFFASLLLLSPLFFASSELAAQTPQADIVGNANNVLNQIMAVPAKQIPQSMLADAQGIAIVPDVVKGGFIVGLRHGKGIVVVREPGGGWRAPVFISLTGGSVGWQAGIQATDVILVFKTQKSVQGLMEGKFTIGADAAAAAGPVGRQAAAATDSRLGAEIYSYSRSRGLFAGIALDGSVLQVDAAANQAYYQGGYGAGGPLPASAQTLLQNIARYTSATNAPVASDPMGSPLPPNAAGAPVDLSPQDTRPLSQQLATASQRLASILDDNWKAFLALPPSIYTGGAAPQPASMNDALKRFDTVAKDPRYAALAQRAEFRETHALLQRYIQQLSASSRGGLVLPPPPGQAGTAAQPKSRY